LPDAVVLRAKFWVENNPQTYLELARRHAATVRLAG